MGIQNNLALDMSNYVTVDGVAVFPFNIEKSLSVATSITLINVLIPDPTTMENKRWSAIPAYYNITDKTLHVPDNTGILGYYVISGNTLRYT